MLEVHLVVTGAYARLIVLWRGAMMLHNKTNHTYYLSSSNSSLGSIRWLFQTVGI